MVKVLHSSDLHGRWDDLCRNLDALDYDVWLDTGDFFPNKTRGSWHVEPEYQQHMFGWYVHYIVQHLQGRPVIIMPGNHDFTDLGKLLVAAGHPADQIFRPNLNEVVTVGGLTWAGFRHIPWIAGEWNCEVEGYELVEKVQLLDKMNPQPDVLVTHAPPAGILAAGYGGADYGIPPLANWHAYKNKRTRCHFFGHVHEQGGERAQISQGGATCTFYNGAEHTILHEIQMDSAPQT